MGRRRPIICKYCGGRSRRGAGICQTCETRPKEENLRRLKVDRAFDTLCHFLLQSNISANNISTMESFREIDDEGLREFLEIALEIARLKPHKRRRWKWLQTNHPD